MARIWIIVPPLTGHLNPTVSVGAALRARGHAVSWVGHPSALSRVLPKDASRLRLPEAVPSELLAAMTERSNRVRGLASLKFLWEDFLVPLARQMHPALETVFEAETRAGRAPQLLLVDQQAVAGALFARTHGLPWATSCTTSAGITNPLAGLPKVKAWLDTQLANLECEAGLPPSEAPDRSPSLTLVYSTPALTGPCAANPEGAYPSTILFVGPSIAARRAPTSQAGQPSGTRAGDGFPWDRLDPTRPKVLLSLGTVNAARGRRFFEAAIEGLGDKPGRPSICQLILLAPAELVGPLPDNILRFDFVPQLDLLPKLQAVISHGGQNTVAETLAHGLPLVVAPIRDDQPVIAEQITRAGCGLRLRFSRCSGQELRLALQRILEEDAFRDAARAIQASFAAAGGAERAADALEKLLASTANTSIPTSENTP